MSGGAIDHTGNSAVPAGPAARGWQELKQHTSPEDLLIFTRPEAARLIDAIFAGSPYLTGLVLNKPDAAARAIVGDPDALLAKLCDSLREDTSQAETETAMRRLLRHRRAQAALLMAIADLSGVWTIDQVMRGLTLFAEAALKSTVDWLLREAARMKRLSISDPNNPALDCRYTVLAMGKLGAGELNFSSDIDLIVLYDREKAPLADGVEPATFFVRMTKKLVALLQEPTEDGYAYRVDLRLRPDPRATQIAISMEAAAIYYESMGQNWERAAMIKARPVAGDIALGEEFLARLVPYIWRKYLDFAAIADVQSLKRQIHAVKGHGEVAVRGHNIKLGRGGIREIEFFVQTQQLIAGGRNPKLRGLRTLDMLSALADSQWIAPAAAEELTRAYRLLRKIEHRLQMTADEQTHTIPEEEEAFARLTRFAGYDSPEAFENEMRATLETVQKHYAALFKDAEELGTEKGSLVFTGGEDDPETLSTLREMGFRHPSVVSATIRGWHFGRYPATRSARARERLTELMPALLTALARSGDADQAFIAFDRFLAGLPTGVQMFSLLRSNPDLLDLIATILGAAPRLAAELSHRPKVLDAVLDPGFFGPLPKSPELQALIESAIPSTTPLDETIDRARVIAKEQMFRIGVRILSETVGATEAGGAFSDLADAILRRLHAAVANDISARHGIVPSGRSAVLALGKLGSREMTAASDLDLVLVYDHAPGAESSSGSKPLSVNQYYARLTQRLIAALTSPTAEGILYQVDMRLRPSGNKGPVATSLTSFRNYHRGSAWTWEHLALTRARVVAGDEGLGEDIAAIVRATLTAKRDSSRTIGDVLDMRRLMLKEHGPKGPWDIKQVRGGLVDVEFIAQALQLLHGERNAAILDANTGNALGRLAAAGCLKKQEAAALHDACRLYQRLTQILRLCVAGIYDPGDSPAGLNRIVASAAGLPDLASTEALLVETQGRIAGLFEDLIGPLQTSDS
jgi:glutamate-ammonia-ligase adenylyltransferase